MGVDHIGITLMPNSVARARLTEASNLMEATNKEVVRAISLRALWGRCANDSRRAEHFFETLTEFPGPECIFWIRAAATFRDLFICAKYLFVEATASPQTWAGGSRPFSSEPRGRLGGVQRREAMKLPIILAVLLAITTPANARFYSNWRCGQAMVQVLEHTNWGEDGKKSHTYALFFDELKTPAIRGFKRLFLAHF